MTDPKALPVRDAAHLLLDLPDADWDRARKQAGISQKGAVAFLNALAALTKGSTNDRT